MATVLGIWHLTLEGGEEKTIQPPFNVRITNIALGEEIVDEGRTVVKLKYERTILGGDPDDSSEEDSEKDDDDVSVESTVLCALTPGKIEQAAIDITLDNEALFAFSATGKNTVYLTGNYISQVEDEGPSDEDDFTDEEDAFDLREVSSDVEMHPDDLDGFESDASRFEEVDEEPVKSAKRPRESDATEDQKSEPASAGKKNKKLKADDGKAVSTPDVDATPKADKQEKKKKDKTQKSEGGEKSQKTEEGKEKKEAKGDKAKRTIAGGVVIQDAKIGTGPQAKKGNTVRMRYIGKLTNGKVFDKNVAGKPVIHFPPWQGGGWDEGIVGMQVGGERVLTIPPNMAYGKQRQGEIPANSTLIFEVKLLEIK
ncbi:hypothetical protein CVT26_000312 [Gymnopilus dilepis]|uniref:FK506-binding protein n=1 Tax=Gymnopilus dilepis TaxID=231916 RepID=A0A409VHH3_9AGAR|nr:hypothetical protein CVT26_000312 [Gymnopilus dilepis]